jgi:tRNA-splicing ligase RtcB
MDNKIKSLGEHRKQFQTDKMKVPAILHVSDDLMPNEDTLEEIEQTAASGYVFHHFAAMSDVHSKKGRKNPAGTVVPAKGYFLPQINDTSPNCGMRFLKTNLTDADLSSENIDKLFNALLGPIPTKAYVGTTVPYSLVMDICRKGTEPVTKYFQTKTKNEIENTFKSGNLSEDGISEKDILDAIPKLFFWIGKYRLGILGAAGNHFLDLMKVTDVKDETLAEKMGVKKGQYIFLMHTGSGLFGQYASYLYTPKEKEHFSQKVILELGKMTFRPKDKKAFKELNKKIEEYKNKTEYIAYREDSPEGRMFITAHRAAANHGFANRTILTHNLDQTIEKVLGVSPGLDLLYDMPHVFVDKENHYGSDVWVHRNNASRAFGPARMKNHPLFRETGEPVFIPSSMSTPAYLAVGTDENESTFFSAPHGTGRSKYPKSDKAATKDELFAKMEKRKVKLFNAKSKGVVFQDASYYKDVEEVVAGMEENKIVKPVAKMDPVAVLMY